MRHNTETMRYPQRQVTSKGEGECRDASACHPMCKTCISSIEINRILMCRIIDQPAVKVCLFYCYEPGTTDE